MPVTLFYKSDLTNPYITTCQQSTILLFSNFFSVSLSLSFNSEEWMVSDTFHLVEVVESCTFSINSNKLYTYKYYKQFVPLMNLIKHDYFTILQGVVDMSIVATNGS